MLISETNPAHGATTPFGATMQASAKSTKPSEIELEIIDLFSQFRTPLLRYVVSLGLPVHDGEEVIQEVFLALFRHLQQGKSRQHLRGWIFRVAHNLGLKQIQANRKVQAVLYTAEEGSQQLQDASPNPEQQVADRQSTQTLQAVLRVLPELDRRCLNLRAEGLRYREIAATLGVSLGTVSFSARSCTGAHGARSPRIKPC